MGATTRIESLCDSGYSKYCSNNKINESTESIGMKNEYGGNVNINMFSGSLDKKQDLSESIEVKPLNNISDQRTQKNTQINNDSQF